MKLEILIRAISHMSQGCDNVIVSALDSHPKGHTTNKDCPNLCHAYFSEVGRMQNFGKAWNIIYSLSCRNPYRLFIHDNFFAP